MNANKWCWLAWLAASGAGCQGQEVPASPPAAATSGERSPFAKFSAAISAVAPGGELELQLASDGFRARPSETRAAVRARLPELATGFVRLDSSARDVSVSFRMEGARPIVARLEREQLVYERGGPHGSDVLLAAREHGVEDYVRFEQPGARSLSYELDVTGVAGLRLFGNALELLNERGVPRLRVSPPYVLDDAGVTRDAQLRLEGCDYDRSPAPPHHRRITRPSSSMCRLHVDWDDSGLRYPLVVDPRWSTPASNLGQPRVRHAATYISADEAVPLSERVCLIGGHDGKGGDGQKRPTKLIECYIEGTWTPAGELQVARYDHTATTLFNKQVLVVGGSDENGPLQSFEIYDPSTFTSELRAAPLPVVPRSLHSATVVSSGEVVILGGGSLVPLVFAKDGSTVEPATGAPMSGPRFGHAAVLASSKVFVFGGASDPKLSARLDSVGYFDPTVDVNGFKEVAARMNAPRIGHTATRMPPVESAQQPMGEQVLVVGNNLDAELFDPVGLKFRSTPGRTRVRRTNHAAVPIIPKDGSAALVVLIGGSDDGFVWDQNEVYSGTRGQWSEPDLLLNERREGHTASLLGDGQTVVVAGGQRSSSGGLFTTTTEYAVLRAPGESCEISSDCVSGVCSGGVCCNSQCEGDCEACSVELGAEMDGVCSTLEAGAECGDSRDCSKPTTCDGSSPRCPEPEAVEDGEACVLEGASAVCSAGVCITPEGAGGEGGVGGTGLGGEGQGGAAPAPAEPAPAEPAPEPAIRWQCALRPTPPAGEGTWPLAALFGLAFALRRAGGRRG